MAVHLWIVEGTLPNGKKETLGAGGTKDEAESLLYGIKLQNTVDREYVDFEIYRL